MLPDSNYDDELRIAIARAIYNDPYFIHYADQSHPPLPIIVDNGNVTFEGVVASVMDGALLPRQNPCPAKQSRAK